MAEELDLQMIASFKFHGIPLWPFILVGVCVVSSTFLSFFYRLLRGIFTRLLPFANFKELGTWACVTGASDGIGQAYAELLAGKGMNIVLISRTASKLETVAEGIMEKHPNVKVRIVIADFSRTDIYENIEQELKDLDIGVLINNVGQSCDDIQYYWETSREFVKSQLNINIYSMCLMTHIVMPKMVAKNKGFIVNVASLAGSLPPYFFVMYGSTKNFMKRFTYGLQLECQDYCPGVIVQDLSPWFVATKMARLKGRGNIFAPDPTDYVAGCLKTVGLNSTSGHISHEIQNFLFSCLPSRVVLFIITLQMQFFRRMAIRDKEKAK